MQKWSTHVFAFRRATLTLGVKTLLLLITGGLTRVFSFSLDTPNKDRSLGGRNEANLAGEVGCRELADVDGPEELWQSMRLEIFLLDARP